MITSAPNRVHHHTNNTPQANSHKTADRLSDNLNPIDSPKQTTTGPPTAIPTPLSRIIQTGPRSYRFILAVCTQADASSLARSASL